MDTQHTHTGLSTNGSVAAPVKTCLIVDDSTVIRRVAARMLAELGYATSEATNGLEAVERCKEEHPSLVLLDWNMPVMDGLTCLKTLRESDITPQPLIMLCTTENTIEKIQTAIRAGANEYIMKPFDRDVLHDKLVHLGLEQPA